jgi:hypothetical protein
MGCSPGRTPGSQPAADYRPEGGATLYARTAAGRHSTPVFLFRQASLIPQGPTRAPLQARLPGKQAYDGGLAVLGAERDIGKTYRKRRVADLHATDLLASSSDWQGRVV